MNKFQKNLFQRNILRTNLFIVTSSARTYSVRASSHSTSSNRTSSRRVNSEQTSFKHHSMIVHILPPASGFPAVSYNTNKIDRNKGELMKVSGFGALQVLQQLRPEDYKIHLRMVAAGNKHVQRPQFHAVLSAKGKEYDKAQLSDIAEKWLEAMGFGKQPYLIIYHKDTNNNHVHMVSARVDHNGKKISDRFEKLRAVQELNRIMGIDLKHNAASDIASALNYQFATRAQFMMILETQGYILRENGEQFQVIKFGRQLDAIGLNIIAERIASYKPDTNRKTQLKAIFQKYAQTYSTGLTKNRSAYQSAFSAFLKEKFGIDLLFHASAGKPPYGYSVIDHSGKQVFKGGEIMPLRDMLSFRQNQAGNVEGLSKNNFDNVSAVPSPEQIDYYAALLKAAIYNYPDLIQGLHHQGLTVSRNGETFYLHDSVAGFSIYLDDLLNETDYSRVIESFKESQEINESTFRNHQHLSGINLASDIDDEAIHGRNRHRKKKARTNSR